MVTRNFQKPTLFEEITSCWQTCSTEIRDFLNFWITFIWTTYISLLIATERPKTERDESNEQIERHAFKYSDNIVEEDEEEEEVLAVEEDKEQVFENEVNIEEPTDIEVIINDGADDEVVQIDIKEKLKEEEEELPWAGKTGGMTRYAGSHNLNLGFSGLGQLKPPTDKSLPSHQERMVTPNAQPVLLSRKIGSPLILTPQRGMSIDEDVEPVDKTPEADKGTDKELHTDDLWESLVKKYAGEELTETNVMISSEDRALIHQISEDDSRHPPLPDLSESEFTEQLGKKLEEYLAQSDEMTNSYEEYEGEYILDDDHEKSEDIELPDDEAYEGTDPPLLAADDNQTDPNAISTFNMKIDLHPNEKYIDLSHNETFSNQYSENYEIKPDIPTPKPTYDTNIVTEKFKKSNNLSFIDEEDKTNLLFLNSFDDGIKNRKIPASSEQFAYENKDVKETVDILTLKNNKTTPADGFSENEIAKPEDDIWSSEKEEYIYSENIWSKEKEERHSEDFGREDKVEEKLPADISNKGKEDEKLSEYFWSENEVEEKPSGNFWNEDKVDDILSTDTWNTEKEKEFEDLLSSEKEEEKTDVDFMSYDKMEEKISEDVWSEEKVEESISSDILSQEKVEEKLSQDFWKENKEEWMEQKQEEKLSTGFGTKEKMKEEISKDIGSEEKEEEKIPVDFWSSKLEDVEPIADIVEIQEVVDKPIKDLLSTYKDEGKSTENILRSNIIGETVEEILSSNKEEKTVDKPNHIFNLDKGEKPEDKLNSAIDVEISSGDIGVTHKEVYTHEESTEEKVAFVSKETADIKEIILKAVEDNEDSIVKVVVDTVQPVLKHDKEEFGGKLIARDDEKLIASEHKKTEITPTEINDIEPVKASVQNEQSYIEKSASILKFSNEKSEKKSLIKSAEQFGELTVKIVDENVEAFSISVESKNEPIVEFDREEKEATQISMEEKEKITEKSVDGVEKTIIQTVEEEKRKVIDLEEKESIVKLSETEEPIVKPTEEEEKLTLKSVEDENDCIVKLDEKEEPIVKSVEDRETLVLKPEEGKNESVDRLDEKVEPIVENEESIVKLIEEKNEITVKDLPIDEPILQHKEKIEPIVEAVEEKQEIIEPPLLESQVKVADNDAAGKIIKPKSIIKKAKPATDDVKLDKPKALNDKIVPKKGKVMIFGKIKDLDNKEEELPKTTLKPARKPMKKSEPLFLSKFQKQEPETKPAVIKSRKRSTTDNDLKIESEKLSVGTTDEIKIDSGVANLKEQDISHSTETDFLTKTTLAEKTTENSLAEQQVIVDDLNLIKKHDEYSQKIELDSVQNLPNIITEETGKQIEEKSVIDFSIAKTENKQDEGLLSEKKDNEPRVDICSTEKDEQQEKVSSEEQVVVKTAIKKENKEDDKHEDVISQNETENTVIDFWSTKTGEQPEIVATTKKEEKTAVDLLSTNKDEEVASSKKDTDKTVVDFWSSEKVEKPKSILSSKKRDVEPVADKIGAKLDSKRDKIVSSKKKEEKPVVDLWSAKKIEEPVNIVSSEKKVEKTVVDFWSENKDDSKQDDFVTSKKETEKTVIDIWSDQKHEEPEEVMSSKKKEKDLDVDFSSANKNEDKAEKVSSSKIETEKTVVDFWSAKRDEPEKVVSHNKKEEKTVVNLLSANKDDSKQDEVVSSKIETEKTVVDFWSTKEDEKPKKIESSKKKNDEPVKDIWSVKKDDKSEKFTSSKKKDTIPGVDFWSTNKVNDNQVDVEVSHEKTEKTVIDIWSTKTEDEPEIVATSKKEEEKPTVDLLSINKDDEKQEEVVSSKKETEKSVVDFWSGNKDDKSEKSTSSKKKETKPVVDFWSTNKEADKQEEVVSSKKETEKSVVDFWSTSNKEDKVISSKNKGEKSGLDFWSANKDTDNDKQEEIVNSKMKEENSVVDKDHILYPEQEQNEPTVDFWNTKIDNDEPMEDISEPPNKYEAEVVKTLKDRKDEKLENLDGNVENDVSKEVRSVDDYFDLEDNKEYKINDKLRSDTKQSQIKKNKVITQFSDSCKSEPKAPPRYRTSKIKKQDIELEKEILFAEKDRFDSFENQLLFNADYDDGASIGMSDDVDDLSSVNKPTTKTEFDEDTYFAELQDLLVPTDKNSSNRKSVSPFRINDRDDEIPMDTSLVKTDITDDKLESDLKKYINVSAHLTEEEQRELEEIRVEQAALREAQVRELNKFLEMPAGLTEQEQLEFSELLEDEEDEKKAIEGSEARLAAILAAAQARHMVGDEDIDEYMELPYQLTEEEEKMLDQAAKEISPEDMNEFKSEEEYREFVKQQYLLQLEEDRMLAEDEEAEYAGYYDDEDDYDYDYEYEDEEYDGEYMETEGEIVAASTAVSTAEVAVGTEVNPEKKSKKLFGFLNKDSKDKGVESKGQKDTKKFFQFGGLGTKKKKGTPESGTPEKTTPILKKKTLIK